MDTTTLFQFFLIFLVLFWPVWAILFAFLRWLIKEARVFPGRLASRKTTRSSNGSGEEREPVNVHDLSHAHYAGMK